MRRARATIRLDLSKTDADPAAVAGAVAPDDTSQMTSRLEGEKLETRIERDSVGGLRSTIDDSVVNCRVAARVATIAIPATGTDDVRERDDTGDGDERES